MTKWIKLPILLVINSSFFSLDCVETEEEGTVWLVLYIVVVAISVYFVLCIIVRRCRKKPVEEATRVTQSERQEAEVEEQPIVKEPPEEPLRYLEIVDLTSDSITPAQDMTNSLAVNTTRRLSSVVAGSSASKGTANSSNKAQLK